MINKKIIGSQIIMISVLVAFTSGIIFSVGAIKLIFSIFLVLSLILYYRFYSLNLEYKGWYRSELKYYAFLFIFLLNAIVAIGNFIKSNRVAFLAFTTAAILIGMGAISVVKKYKEFKYHSFYSNDNNIGIRKIKKHLENNNIKVERKKTFFGKIINSEVIILVGKKTKIKYLNNNFIILSKYTDNIKSLIDEIESK